MTDDNRHTRDTNVYKVVGAHELEKWTSAGWRLEKLVTDQRIEERMDSVPLVVPYSGGGCGVQMQSVTRSIPVTTNLFLLCKEEGTYLEDLQQKHADLSVKTTALVGEVDALTKQVATHTKAIEHKDILITNANDNASRASVALHKTEELNRQLEKDIAKIRTAIGERQMRDILDAAATAGQLPFITK